MRYLKISKELIRNVLEKETENLPDDFTFDIIDNYIIFADDGECMFEINIYEFAFKCKEWAYTNKYRLSSGQHRLNTKQEHYINNQIASYFCSVYYITNDDSDIQIDANTEPEGIFKACQWILENSK